MATGIVKWFNSAKGYGFICPDGGGQDVFSHFSSIIMEGYKTLKAGQVVHFEIHEGPKGLHATNIRPQPMPEDFEQGQSYNPQGASTQTAQRATQEDYAEA